MDFFGGGVGIEIGMHYNYFQRLKIQAMYHFWKYFKFRCEILEL